MRPFAVQGDTLQLGLADVPDALVPVVERLGFERAGMVFVRRFPGDAPYAARAAARFELCAEAIVQVSDTVIAERIAAALADILVEPLVDGGRLGARWYRAFGPARIEGVGDYAGTIVDEGTVAWRGAELRVGSIG